MGKPIFTASAGDRVAACPDSEALPHAHRENRDAKRGTVRHAYFQAIPNIGEKEALALAGEKYRKELARIDLSRETGIGEYLDSSRFLQEVAYAFDVETGKARVLGENLNRDYSEATENEVVGTADLVGLTEDAVVIPDFKGPHAWLEPKEMRQLRFLALAASRAHGKTRAIAGVIPIREDGSSVFVRVDFDEFELASFELELRDIAARVKLAKAGNTRGVLVLGDHCRYCPAIDYCPALMGMVRATAAAPDQLTESLAGATEEQLALAWERISALSGVVDRVKEAIRTRARQKPIPLAKGMVLGEVEVETLKPEVAAMVLEALHGEAVAAAAVETKQSITKTSIERALRSVVVKGGPKLTHLKNAVLAAVREAEGVVVRLDVKKRAPTPEEQGPALQAQLEASVAQVEEKALEAGGA